VTNALLSSDPHNHLVIAYNLIVDNKRIEDQTAKLSLEEFYSPHSPPTKPGDQPSAHRHPERMDQMKGLTSTLDTTQSQGTTITTQQLAQRQSPHVKRAKWHLGIRSQSRPEDIMYEVFRAMRTLEFEWRVINPYHVIVKRKGDPVAPKMSLQLYQVDQRSYLLDFKSLTDEASEDFSGGSGSSSRHASVSTPNKPAMARTGRAQSLPMPMEIDGTPPPSPTASLKQSQTMQFFEMCASLIGTLAR